MKATIHTPYSRFLVAAVLVAAIAVGNAASAQSSAATAPGTSPSPSAEASSNKRQTGNTAGVPTTQVKVTRATTFLGMDVVSSDGQKIGDIADFVYDVSDTPRLQYVIVNSGSFLGFGGDARAVPAGAINSDGRQASLQISQDDFWGVPVMPQNRARYLANSDNAARIDQAFDLSSGSRSAQQGDSTKSLVLFSDLRNAEIYDRQGEEFGNVADTWISLDLDRAPYLEILANADLPFAVEEQRRFAVPLQHLQVPAERAGEYRIEVDEDQIRDAQFVSDTEGVRMLEPGYVGRAVLRVRMPQVAE